MEQKFIARLFDELEPCYPDTNVIDGVTHYTTAGTNGTYAGVNILMSGITTGIPITFEVKGETTAFKLFEMLPVPVEVNTGAKLRSEYLKNDHNENVIRRAPFMIYEALEPIYNIVMPTMSTMAVCFKTIIEYCTKNHTENWQIIITHGNCTVELSFSVDQYTFTVPKAGLDTHKFVNWFSFNAISSYHNVEKWSAPYNQLMEKYFRAAVFSRQNMLAIPLEECFNVKDNICTLNEEILLKIITIAQKAGMVYFQGGAVATRALNLIDNDDFYNSLKQNDIKNSDEIAVAFKEKAFDYFDNGTKAVVSLTNESIPDKNGEATIKSITNQLYGFIIKNNLTNVWIQCALDEPNDALCETYNVITSIIRQEMPNIPILEPVLPTEKVIGALDIWCPSLDVYEQNRNFFDERVNQGDRLFVYSCLTPGGNYCNRLLDLERLRIVWLGWAPAKYTNIEGFLHWGANQFSGDNPFKRSAAMFSEQILEFHPKRAMFLPAGDAYIFYPGFNQPLISVRSEAHRIGYEDLYLLLELKKRDEKLADEIIESVFRGYADYEKSVAKYRLARKKLIESLC